MYTIKELTNSYFHDQEILGKPGWSNTRPFMDPNLICHEGLGKTSLDQLCVTSRKVVDIVIKHDNMVIVQFEEQSSLNQQS